MKVMKKLCIPFVLAFILMSCSEPATSDLTTKQVYSFRVKATDWIEKADNAGLNKFYSASFSINGLNSYIYDEGSVTTYMVYSNYQQVLPYTRHYENFNGQKWSRTIDFDFSVKNIVFYVTNSDFDKDPPEEMYFRVVLMW
jgi:hypothetical protein